MVEPVAELADLVVELADLVVELADLVVELADLVPELADPVLRPAGQGLSCRAYRTYCLWPRHRNRPTIQNSVLAVGELAFGRASSGLPV